MISFHSKSRVTLKYTALATGQGKIMSVAGEFVIGGTRELDLSALMDCWDFLNWKAHKLYRTDMLNLSKFTLLQLTCSPI